MTSRHRWRVTIAATVAGAAVAATFAVINTTPPANQSTVNDVIQHAGIKPGTHVGPTWKASP